MYPRMFTLHFHPLRRKVSYITACRVFYGDHAETENRRTLWVQLILFRSNQSPKVNRGAYHDTGPKKNFYNISKTNSKNRTSVVLFQLMSLSEMVFHSCRMPYPNQCQYYVIREPEFARNCAKICTVFLHFWAQKKIRDKFSKNLPPVFRLYIHISGF